MLAAIPSGLASRLHEPQDQRREDQPHRQLHFPAWHDDDAAVSYRQ
jgi:hypothetical protein